MCKLLVIIPAYNEGLNIGNVIKDLQENVPYADILVINDSSRDNTVQVLKESGTTYLNTPYNLGYAGVLQTGFKYAVRSGYQFAAQFDGDGQHMASELDRMYQTAIHNKSDIVIGSRFLTKSGYKHPFMRKLGTLFFRITIRIISGKTISDPTSGLQILSKRVYTQYSEMNNYPEYPDANLITEMLFQGYSITEIPVSMRERKFGESMHSGIYKPLAYMIKMAYSLLLMIIKYRSKRNQKVLGEDN